MNRRPTAVKGLGEIALRVNDLVCRVLNSLCYDEEYFVVSGASNEKKRCLRIVVFDRCD